jgi:2-polyprenylphenol 6-hydroxylase
MTPAKPNLSEPFDLLIAGHGMVGAALACALKELPLRIGIVDSQPLRQLPTGEETSAGQAPAFDSRVSAISPASRDILMQLGAWPMIAAQRHCPYSDMRVWEADGTAAIHFSAAEIHADELGYIVENRILVAALHECLRQQGNVRVLPSACVNGIALPSFDSGSVSGSDPDASARPTPAALTVTLSDGSAVQTRLLIGADGASSRVRELAGFNTREWDYGHEAIVATVRTSAPHAGTAAQRFMDSGILALLPLSTAPAGSLDSERYCSIVWSVLPGEAARLQALDDAAFCAALTRASEACFGSIDWCGPRQSFPLRQRHATDYVKAHIALIGDAAHSIHPLAGQGVNLGMLDAWALATQIRRALGEQRDFWDTRILRRYQRKRIGHNLAMMGLMEGFRRLYADQPLLLRWLRNTGMRGIDGMPVIKHQLMRQAMGIDHSVARSG